MIKAQVKKYGLFQCKVASSITEGLFGGCFMCLTYMIGSVRFIRLARRVRIHRQCYFLQLQMHIQGSSLLGECRCIGFVDRRHKRSSNVTSP